MEEKVEEKSAENDLRSNPQSEEELRKELYKQFNVSRAGRLGIQYILPLLDKRIQVDSIYDVTTRSKILAEIALYQAYKREPKFRLLLWGVVLIGVYDYLHYLNPAFYGLLLGAVTTLNGFVGALQSPSMMAAELEGTTDEDGMPADYRATAHSSANTNVTLVLFVFAVGIQLLVTSSIVQGEILTHNVADGTFPFAASALLLLHVPVVVNQIWERIRGR